MASGNDVADVSSVANVAVVATPTSVAMWQVAQLESRIFKFFTIFLKKFNKVWCIVNNFYYICELNY